MACAHSGIAASIHSYSSGIAAIVNTNMNSPRHCRQHALTHRGIAASMHSHSGIAASMHSHMRHCRRHTHTAALPLYV